MAEVSVEELPQKTRDLFNKGSLALERGTLDYALDLLGSCVRAAPRFLNGRKFLRAAQIQKFKKSKSALLAHLIGLMRNLPNYYAAMGKLRAGKAAEAMNLCELMMNNDPLDVRVITLFSHSADAMELHEVAIQTLQIARDHHPANIDILKMLGEQYIKAGQTKAATETFEKLSEMCPRDPDVLKMLKDATALESIAKDGVGAGGDIRERIKDVDEAVLLERQAKAKKADKDLDSLIEDTKKKLEQEPENINYYRSLARLYAEKRQFDEALAMLEKATEMFPGDPELDNAWSAMRVKKYDADIAELQAVDNQEEVEKKEQEKAQFVFDDLQERVSRYPNDLGLRYEWGVKLFDNDYIDEAIHEFQRSQRSPKHRHLSLYYMAMCFKNKKQYDLAIDQLTTASQEMSVMDDTKKDVLYELGVILETSGELKKAAEYYKQIYQVDIGYKDIRERIEKAYGT